MRDARQDRGAGPAARRSGIGRWIGGALALAAFAGGGCVVREDESVTRLRFTIWGTPAQLKIEQEIVRAFEAANPGIHVEVIAMGSQRYQEKLQAMMVGNVAPDVLIANHSMYDDWAVRGALADLTDLQREIQADLTLMPGAREVFERDGHFFGLPVNAHGFVTFVNLDAFAAAGIPVPDEGFTWEQIDQFGLRLSRRFGDPKAPTEYAMVAPGYLHPLLAELGGSFFDDPYHPTRATVDSPEGAAWFEWLRRLEDSGYSAPRSLIPPDLVTYDLFRDQRVALYFIGRWQVPDLAGRTKFRWDVRPFPAGPKGRVTWHGGTIICVSAKTAHAEAARTFARFYAGREGQRIAMRGGRYVPVYRELARSPEFLDLRPPDSPQYFVDTMEEGTATSWLYAPGVEDVWRLANSRIEEALANRSITAQEAARRLAGDFERWLQRQRHKGIIPES